MTSYLSFAYNPKDVTAFNRIINVPKRGVGQVTLDKILDVNLEYKDSLLDTIEKIIKRKTTTTFTPAVIIKLKDFFNICQHIRAMIDDKVPLFKNKYIIMLHIPNIIYRIPWLVS
ncbi:MAG: hypothetical protein JSY10_29550 [Paenibacillus sp.]|nr:hypothetical protein [Paenibacillus sp.]